VYGGFRLIVVSIFLDAAMAQPGIGNVDNDCHPKVRELVDYWLSIHPSEGLPGRRHFDPVDIPGLLPNICLIDVPTRSTDFSFRLMGTRMVDYYGSDFTGKPFESAYVKHQESQAYIDLCKVVATRLPRWRRGPSAFVKNREHVIVERVFVPLAEDGWTVNIVLALLLAKFGGADFS
jgi:hypothetical protein